MFIDSVSTVLDKEVQQRNFQRWPVLGQYVWPNAFVGQTFQQEVDWLKDWTTKRLLWMDANITDVISGVEQKGVNRAFAIHVYPNPFTDQFQLKYELDEAGSIEVEVMDIFGRKLESFERYHPEAGTYDAVIQPKNIPAGMYLMKAQFGNKQAH